MDNKRAFMFATAMGLLTMPLVVILIREAIPEDDIFQMCVCTFGIVYNIIFGVRVV